MRLSFPALTSCHGVTVEEIARRIFAQIPAAVSRERLWACQFWES